ncbi:MAG: hypothetical protein [Bacteriophage sp.]|nr:MAG: hypothetical protein [Bacteriophage sp.]
MKEIDDQVLLIVKYLRELMQAEDVGDWDKVVRLEGNSGPVEITEDDLPF